jgi:hypothetical protein
VVATLVEAAFLVGVYNALAFDGVSQNPNESLNCCGRGIGGSDDGIAMGMTDCENMSRHHCHNHTHGQQESNATLHFAFKHKNVVSSFVDMLFFVECYIYYHTASRQMWFLLN